MSGAGAKTRFFPSVQKEKSHERVWLHPVHGRIGDQVSGHYDQDTMAIITTAYVLGWMCFGI